MVVIRCMVSDPIFGALTLHWRRITWCECCAETVFPHVLCCDSSTLTVYWVVHCVMKKLKIIPTFLSIVHKCGTVGERQAWIACCGTGCKASLPLQSCFYVCSKEDRNVAGRTPMLVWCILQNRDEIVWNGHKQSAS
jgi:hypothetical protein